MVRRGLPILLLAGLSLLSGCLHPVCEKVDGVICGIALEPRDLQPLLHGDPSPTSPPEEKPGKDENPEKGEKQRSIEMDVTPASWRDRERNDEKNDLPTPRGRLSIPQELMPAGSVPPIKLPPLAPETEAARKKAVEQMFPPLPPLGDDPPDPPGPEGRPLCLSDLQRLALTNSPLIRQATARVEEARGAAIQAGLAPNPTIGFEADTTGTTGGAGYVGGFFEQTLKTSNKLQLARAAAAVELKNAELALFKAQTDLATRVRSGYFAVLVAQESVRLNRALVRFTSDVFQLQVDQVLRGGFAAPYEPMYLRVLAVQARAALVQARNRRTAAWKQLAATLGLPGMPPTQLAGRLDVPIPAFRHQDVLAKTLKSHSDILTAENELLRAGFRLELERRTPLPDVNLRVMLQKDNTGPPFQASPSVAVSVPVPVWDRNQGNILTAQASAVRASEESHRVRTELTRQLAEAFERYENNRVLLTYYRDQILPDLVRVYRGVYERYQREPAGPAGSPPGFTEVVVAQQNLAQAVASYIGALGNQWQAVVDVADMLQTFDLFGVHAATHPVPEIPDLEKLPPLPCCHNCSPLKCAHQHVVDRGWRSAEHPSTAQILEPAPLPMPRENRSEKRSTPPILPGTDPARTELPMPRRK